MTRAPTDARVIRVRDVLPVIYVGEDSGRTDPAGDPPIPIARGVVLKQFDAAEVELVQHACMARGHYFVPTYQEMPLWGFERELDPAVLEEHQFAWDSDGTLIVTMRLSRLIVDNGYTPLFAARIVEHGDGEQQVIPQWLHHLDLLSSYRLRYDRDWLTADEAAELARLVDAYWQCSETVPKQVTRALSLSEGVVHTHVYDRALVLLMTGLEALLNTGPVSVSKQMKHRLRALADEVGVGGVTGGWAERMYSARSKPAHGQELHLPSATGEPQAEEADAIPAAALADAARLQDLLRAAVRRAIEDTAFAETFRSAEDIRARWPVTGWEWRLRLLRRVPAAIAARLGRVLGLRRPVDL